MPRKSVTCQASAERQIARLCNAPAPVRVAAGLWRHCGNHSSSATSGKNISINSAPCQPPLPSDSGTISADPAAAAAPIVSEYAPVSFATWPGKSRLIKPGNRTLPSAIPQPTIDVPINSSAADGSERTPIPMQISSRAIKRLRSMPRRRATPAARGEIKAKASRGSVVSRPVCAVLKP